MGDKEAADSESSSVSSRRCPLCGLQIEVEEYVNDEGQHYYRCLSRSEDCEDNWQCPLHDSLPADPDQA